MSGILDDIQPYAHFLSVDMNRSVVDRYCEFTNAYLSDKNRERVASKLTDIKITKAKENLKNAKTM